MAEEEPPTKVLAVDDQRGPAELYAAWLEDDYDVSIAIGGEAALEAIDETVDVLLLDRRMPVISGDEVLAEVQRRGLECRVIMVTAVQPDFDIIELGFDAYLTKPVEAAELTACIEQVCARADYENELQTYYGLLEKQHTLEAAKSLPELDESEQYAELERRLAEARDRLESSLDAFDDDRIASAIERTRSLAALREREQRYRSLTEDVLDTSRVGTVIVDESGTVVWANAITESYFGIDRDELLDRDYLATVRDELADRFEDASGFADRVLTAHEDNDGVVEFQCHVPGGTDGERWLRHWSKPIETGLYAGGRIEHYYDVTPLIQRERTLETLHEATRDLIDAETRLETAEISVEAAVSVLGFSDVTLYLWDEETGTLEPAVHTGTAEDPEPAGEGPVWEAFVAGETAIERSGHCRLRIPLGNQGILVVGDPDPDALADTDVSFAQVLAANTEVALERAERERQLRQRDEQLERRNEQLERLDRINRIVRGIGRVLPDAASETEILQAVCTRLVEVGAYAFVWAGEPDVVTGEINTRARAGAGGDYLDEVAMRAEDDSPAPAWEAMRTGEVHTVQNILEDESFAPWRTPALDRGFRSVASVPLCYDQSVYGVVEVYADRPFAFEDEDREVLGELGETIGHGINAAKRKEALLSGAGIELEFELGSSAGFFAALSAQTGGRVSLLSMGTSSDDDHRVFFSVAGASPSEVLEAADGAPNVTEAQLIRERAEDALFECRVSGRTVVSVVANHGARTRSLDANGDRCRVVVELPRTADVRSFAETLAAEFPDAELLARREQPSTSDRSLHHRLDDRLTDRQRESLETAYFAGYFEWPRENNGESVAGSLGISQPTLQQHLRAGERKLFEELFERG